MPQNINLNDTTPAAGTGKRNVKWQADSVSSDPSVYRNVSAEIDNLGGVNPQTGTTYTLTAADQGKIITLSNAAAIAVTLPNANTLNNNFMCFFRNTGTSTATLTPTTSTVNGAANITIDPNQGLLVFGDGTNYTAQRTGYVRETEISLSDVTTNNVSIAQHGFAPKAPNDATKYLDGSGNWSVPVGSGGGSSSYPAYYTATDPTGVTFTWRNQGGAAVQARTKSVYMSSPAGTGTNLRGQEVAASAAPFSVTIGVIPMIPIQGSQAVGMYVSDGTKLHTIQIVNNTFSMNKYNSATSFNATQLSISTIFNTSPIFFKIFDDGTNLNFYISPNGSDFIRLLQTGRLSFLASISKFGWFVDTETASSDVGGLLISWATGTS